MKNTQKIAGYLRKSRVRMRPDGPLMSQATAKQPAVATSALGFNEQPGFAFLVIFKIF